MDSACCDAVAAIISAVPAAAADSDVISDGVYIGDQDVGGMTTKEAEQYVKGQVRALEDTTVTIQMGEQQSTKTLKELGLKWDNPDLVTGDQPDRDDRQHHPPV